MAAYDAPNTSWISRGNPGGRITPRNLTLAKSRVNAGDCIWIPWPRPNHLTQGCMPYKGVTYKPYSRGLYWRYDATLAIIFQRMVADRVDGAGGVGMWSDCPIFFQWCQPFNLKVLAAWALRVRPHGPWDYKDDLAAKFGDNDKYYTPIPGDPAPERLFYDVWTNIHYGYVGRAHKIPADILHAGAEQFGGSRSVTDWVSNEIGIQLWNQHRDTLTQQQLAGAVLSRMRTFRNDPAFNFFAVRPGLEP